MEFATIPLEDIMKRLFDSNHDSKCFKRLAIDHLPEQDIRPAIRTYEELRARRTEEEHLRALAKACLRDSKYRNFQCLEDVILNSILTSGVPRGSFDDIFGHIENEKESYPMITRLLKRDADFQGREVKNTSTLGRVGGVRYADFTVVKQRRFGRGFEIYSVDVKVRPDAFKTFLDQAHECSLHSGFTWLVCTAGLVLDLARQWSLPPFHALEHFADYCKKQKVGIKIFDATARRLKDLAPSGESDGVSEQIKRRALKKLRYL